MKQNTGYREMLRDRCPKMVSYALKYMSAKEKWLDHVYKRWIWLYKSNEERYRATKNVLGINGRIMKFDFHRTIDWENLSIDDKKYWEDVERYVSWFVNKHMYAEQTYNSAKSKGKSIVDIKLELMRCHLVEFCPNSGDDEKTKKQKSLDVNELTDFIIDTFEGRI